MKLSSFGSFVVRSKGSRMGRNPKTGVQVPITPRRLMVFKPSDILKERLAVLAASDALLKRTSSIEGQFIRALAQKG